MATAVRVLPLRTPQRVGLAWGLSIFVWLLPVHILVITVLFGVVGLPGPTVRVIAAWKEALIGLLFGLALLRVAVGGGPRSAVHWLDLAVVGLGLLGLAYLLGATAWFDAGLPLGAQLYGLRDAVFVSLLYFVGRASPEIVDQPRLLRALFVVGVLTSLVAVLERLFVTPETLLLLGTSRYVQEFLGAAPLTTGNVYGLPDSYWTTIGDQLVQRAGSTYLSAQGFAIPFLIIMPAATLWVTSSHTRRTALAWLGYAVLWVALLLSVTRMSIVACLVQTAVIAAARRRWGLLVGGGLAALVAFFAALLLVPGLGAFVWQTLTWQTGSSESHLEDWLEAVNNLVRYPFGVGLGAADQTAVRFGVIPFSADNQYLKYAVELGGVGLALHLATLAGALTVGARAFRVARGAAQRDYGLLLALATVGIAMNAMTATVFNSMMLAYVFFWLAGAVVTAGGGLDRGSLS